MGLSCTVSEINGDFSVKSQNFPTRSVFGAPAEGVSLELSTGARGQKLEWWVTGLRKKFDDIFSLLDTMHKRDRRTDRRTYRRTPGDSKDRAYA